MEEVKKLLLGAFVKKDEIGVFLVNLLNDFNIQPDKTFLYQLLGEDDNFIITFRIFLKGGKRINLKKHFKNIIPIHKKGDAIYTINALNKLIELESGGDVGNIDYKNHKVDWSEYQGNLILVNNDNLLFLKIMRIFND